MIFGLAFRNLVRHAERFRVLLATLVLGGTVSILLMGVTASMTEVLSSKGARYFSGDVMVLGYTKSNDHLLENQDLVLGAIKGSGVPIQSLCRRSIYFANTSLLFFEGTSQRQRRMIGVDWTLEMENFKKMDFLAGGPEGMISGKGILVSDRTADKLKMKVGDDCLVLMETLAGQKNSLDLRVEGIYREPSFFGYSSYVDIKTLNRALGLPESTVMEIGAVLGEGVSQDWAAERIRTRLAEKLPTLPAISSSAELDKVLNQEVVGETRKYGVLTLNVRLAQIKDILDALLTIGKILNGIFLLIVMIGMNNTYRMIVYERTQEIGSMRALGMQRSRLAALFLAEAGFLGLAGAVLGWLLGSLVLYLVTLIPFQGNVLAAMFLERGRFVWSLPIDLTVFVFLSMIAAAVVGALGPALKGARMKPVDALRHEN